jgi:hypothetical protein
MKLSSIALAEIHHEKDVCLSKKALQPLTGRFTDYYPLNFYLGSKKDTCATLSAALAPKVLLSTPQSHPDRKLGCNKGTDWHEANYAQQSRPVELDKSQPGGRVVMFKYERHDGCGEGAKHQLFLWALAHQTEQIYGGQLPSASFHSDHGVDCECMSKFIGLPMNLQERIKIQGKSTKGQFGLLSDTHFFNTDCTGILPEAVHSNNHQNVKELKYLRVWTALAFRYFLANFIFP